MEKNVKIIIIIICIIQFLSGIFALITNLLYLFGKITDNFPCIISSLGCMIVVLLNMFFNVVNMMINRKNK